MHHELQRRRRSILLAGFGVGKCINDVCEVAELGRQMILQADGGFACPSGCGVNMHLDSCWRSAFCCDGIAAAAQQCNNQQHHDLDGYQPGGGGRADALGGTTHLRLCTALGSSHLLRA